MNRPTMLAKAILEQQGLDLSLSVVRDVQTLLHRTKHEGISFLTITLPVLSDALERGIECGQFNCPDSFSRQRRLPRFLGGFFKLVFDSDGRLLDKPSPEAIRSIRQISRFFKKLKMSCSPEREFEAEARFIEVEEELAHATEKVLREDSVLDRVSRTIWSQVFPELDGNEIICTHGPGVTADRRRPNERCRIKHWHDRSEHTFPSDLHAYPNYGLASEFTEKGPEDGGIEMLGIRDEPGVRVVFVPKTQVTPRVIAIEPSHVQYMQQGLMAYVTPLLESHILTRHSIRFSDQGPNQVLAFRASQNKSLATLDLKEASDRVHLALVQRIFKDMPILEYFEDCRSLHANLPSGRNLVLNKFASMGSAMCFPMEAMVFYTLIQTALHRANGICPSSRSIRRFSKMIDIYGDDIIIPVEYTDVVIEYLESFGLLVNRHKSFWKSNFRESCGGDYFNGVDVKPVYLRELPPDGSIKWTPSQVMSLTSTANQLYKTGQWLAAETLREMVSRAVRCRVPLASLPGPGVFFESIRSNTDLFWDKDLQGWRQSRLHFIPLKQKDKIDDDTIAQLNRWGHSHAPDYRSEFALASGVHGRRDLGSSPNPFRGGLEPLGSLDSGHQTWSAIPVDSEGTVRVLPKTLSSLNLGLPKAGNSQLGLLERGREGSSKRLPYGKGGQGEVRNFLQDNHSPIWQVARSYCTSLSVSTREKKLSVSLTTAREKIDFLSSTKRGVFKLSHRWVSLNA